MNLTITQNQPILEVHTQKGLKLISINRIMFIKASGKGSIIYLDTSESVETNYLLKSYSMFLPEPHFCRCHNSFFVNCRFVDCFSNKEIILKGNIRILLSRGKKKEFKEKLIEMQQDQY